MAKAAKSSPRVVGLALVRHSRCISCHTLEVGLASEAALQGPDTGGGGSEARSKEEPKF
jgi:mono/diheme cytochrome c family protein